MPAKSPPKTYRNPFKRYAKIDSGTEVALINAFCLAVSIPTCAAQIRLSHRTVRDTYFDLRARLVKPAFNRWNQLSARLVAIENTEKESLIKDEFIFYLAKCHANKRCYTSYRSGRRKSRICRACPIQKFSSDVYRQDFSTDTVDQVFELYDLLHWGMPKGDFDRDEEFKLRFIHLRVLQRAHHNTYILRASHAQQRDFSFLGKDVLALALAKDIGSDS